MVIRTETWEGGSDEADITTGNTILSSVTKSGGASAKFDTSQNPGGEGTTSARFITNSTSGGTGASGFIQFLTPTPTFDLECHIRMTGLGGYFYAPGNSFEGSLSQNPFFFQLSGGSDIVTFGNAGGHIMVLDPFTATTYQWLSADGNSLLGSRTGAGVFFSINTDHKVRVVGNNATFDVYIDDVKINNIPLPVAGPATTNFTQFQFGSSRAGVVTTWVGDLRLADTEEFIPMGPGGGSGGDFDL